MKSVQALALSAAAASLIGAHAQIASTYTGSAGLNDAAKASGKYMGTATDAYAFGSVSSDSAYMAELKNAKDWGIVTPANSMKPSSLQPNRGQFNYGPADQLVSTIKGMGAKVRCHTLLWHTQVPGWMNTGNNATMLQALDDHITAVMTHYKDDCYAWDVVNEVVSDNGGYRNSFWYNTAGAEYIAHAFRTADKVRKQLGLKVKLYYNDYSIEWEGSAKTNFAKQMVKGLVDAKVGIDGVGFQSHFTVGGTPSQQSFANLMNYYTAMGLDVAVTELDIRTQTPATQAKMQQQLTDYKNVIAACKSVAKCVGVTIWDFDDKYSWVPSTFSGQGYALPFYRNGNQLVRKAVYDSIIDGWGGAPAATVAPTTATPTTATPTTATPTTATPTTATPTTATPTTATPTTVPTTTAPGSAGSDCVDDLPIAGEGNATAAPSSAGSDCGDFPEPSDNSTATPAPSAGSDCVDDMPIAGEPNVTVTPSSSGSDCGDFPEPTVAPTTAVPTTAVPTTSTPATDAPTTPANTKKTKKPKKTKAPKTPAAAPSFSFNDAAAYQPGTV